jgi:hypothetical protein
MILPIPSHVRGPLGLSNPIMIFENLLTQCLENGSITLNVSGTIETCGQDMSSTIHVALQGLLRRMDF